MSPERIEEGLSIIRSTADTMAQALGCYVSIARAWMEGLECRLGQAHGVETLAATHAVVEKLKRSG